MIRAILTMLILALPCYGQGSDSCATPQTIPYNTFTAVNVTGATTGTQGQSSSACNETGTLGIDHDVWFVFTAPSTGWFTVVWGQFTSLAEDPKIAVYKGAGCPTAPAISCQDDHFEAGYSGVYPYPIFRCVSGQTYTLQVGCHPGTAVYTEDLLITTSSSDTFIIDDSTVEAGLPISSGIIGWGQVIDTSAYSGDPLLYNIATTFGAPGGATIPAGLPYMVSVYDDPNDDGNISDRIYIKSAMGTTNQTNNNQPQFLGFDPPLLVHGKIFILVEFDNAGGYAIAPLDTSSGASSVSYVEDASGIHSNTSAGITGRWFLRAMVRGNACGNGFCFGESFTCPCSAGSMYHGCASSYDSRGAVLGASGVSSFVTSLNSDKITLHTYGVGPRTGGGVCIFAQADTYATGVFGDGIDCLGTGIVRLGTRTPSYGECSFGFGITGDPDLTTAGGLNYSLGFPQSVYYQVIYRNSASFCTSSTFNTTNGISIQYE